MNNAFDLLGKSEVHQINSLVKTLDESTFDYLQLELSGMKLTIGKGTAPMNAMAAESLAAPISASTAPTKTPFVAISEPAAIPPPSAAKQASAARDEGTVVVVATTMGRFYSKPEPSAAPFVSVGTNVDADATVGLIEVMKLFNAVVAGVSGVVTEICVEDAQFVEYGQVLLRIKPFEVGSDTAKKE